MIAHFDQNNDGVLQISELPARMQKWMAKADTDGDGNLSAAELQAHADAMKKEHFARMDKNQDGALTQDEVGDRRWSHISVADADNNGSVTQAELDQAFASGKLAPIRQGWSKHDGERHGMRAHHGKAKMLFRMDGDKDGALTQAEVGDEIWAHIGVADANKDGKVTRDELEAAHENGTLEPMRPMMQREEPSAPQAPAEAPAAQ
jgi:Ca2+-binding EF-hand superfamily protein